MVRPMNALRRLWRAESGSVVVEAALTMPMLAAMSIGAFDVWRAVDMTSRLSAAAQAGAQYAMQSGSTTNVSTKASAAYAGDKTNLTIATSTYSQCVNGATPTNGTCTDGYSPLQYVRVVTSDSFSPIFTFAPIGKMTMRGVATVAYQ